MDYMDIMNNFDGVLRLAPLNTTHWHIENNKFVRMGNAVVEGYLSLNILRRVRSHTKALALTGNGELRRIVAYAPDGAEAYSLKSKKYLKHAEGRFFIITAGGVLSEVVCASDVIELIYIDHAEKYATQAA